VSIISPLKTTAGTQEEQENTTTTDDDDKNMRVILFHNKYKIFVGCVGSLPHTTLLENGKCV
jgi:hypothetical protein